MGVTVSDILQLPSLSDARIAAGKRALSRIVSSVSVLEYAEPTPLQDEFFSYKDFIGNEIVITGFINIKDDVDAQCVNIKRMHRCGEIGIILYYVGVFVPKLDKRVTDLADSLDFAIIVMPENRLDLRYSDVISEVMDAIVKDRMTDTYFVSEMLERISLLPKRQRTAGYVLSLLSTRIRACACILDDALCVLNEAVSPKGASVPIAEIIAHFREEKLPLKAMGTLAVDKRKWDYSVFPVLGGEKSKLYLLIADSTGSLTLDVCAQTEEVLHIFMNLWSSGHGDVGTAELIKSILNDEPAKMRRLADILKIDVASIHTLAVLSPAETPSDGTAAVQAHAVLPLVRNISEKYYGIFLADAYENDIVMFAAKNLRFNHEEAAAALSEELKKNGYEYYISIYTNLISTADVREAYAQNAHLSAAKRIFPLRSVFTQNEINLARECGALIEGGERRVEAELSRLYPLKSADGSDEFSKTLAIFLLDANTSVSRTAELLYVHINTAKYRVKRIKELLGYDISRNPGAYYLCRAAALLRLLEQK